MSCRVTDLPLDKQLRDRVRAKPAQIAPFLPRATRAPALLNSTQMPTRILVVDDDAATRVGLVDLLQRAGYDVTGSATFEHARQALRERRPDLLITDIRLGEYNGLQLLVGSPEPIPTVIVTGFIDPVLEAEARAHRAAYLLKPVSARTLLSTVEQVLSQRQAQLIPTRRWSRKRVTPALAADAAGSPARIVDVSYGGLRVEMSRLEEDLPSSFTVRVRELDLPVNVVWRNRTGDQEWVCGLAVTHVEPPVADRWHGLVDALQ